MSNINAVKSQKQNPIEFTTQFDLMADCGGITAVPSGTTPHNPDEVRIIYRNAETRFEVDPVINDRVSELVDAGDERALFEYVDAHFNAIGRATETGWLGRSGLLQARPPLYSHEEDQFDQE